MNMVGDMRQYTQFQVAQSMPIAAANEGGGLAGAGVGLGAGFTMAQQMMNAMRPDQPGGPAPQSPSGARRRRTAGSGGAARRLPRARRNSASNAASRSRSGPNSVPNAERSSSSSQSN